MLDHDTNSKLVDQLDSGNFDSFIDYLKVAGPTLAESLIELFQYEKSYFEQDKHMDLDKYLYNPLLEYTKNYGKLHRPLTAIASYLAVCSGDTSEIDDVLTPALAIENFQTAALIHDDIADAGQIRRGKPCLHKSQGTGLAINAGDLGLSMTIGCVLHTLEKSNYNSSKILEIIKLLNFMEYMTIEGQAMDLGWARDARFDIKQEDYFCMATKKSAYYSALVPCVLGGICADAPEDILMALQTFGEKVGLAFQIRDDLLNLVGDKNSTKDFRNDITEGKRTLCVVKSLELSSVQDSDKLIEILKSHTNDKEILEQAVDIMRKCGAIDFADEKASQLCDEACQVLSSFLPDSKWKSILLSIADWAKDRKA